LMMRRMSARMSSIGDSCEESPSVVPFGVAADAVVVDGPASFLISDVILFSLFFARFFGGSGWRRAVHGAAVAVRRCSAARASAVPCAAASR